MIFPWDVVIKEGKLYEHISYVWFAGAWAIIQKDIRSWEVIERVRELIEKYAKEGSPAYLVAHDVIEDLKSILLEGDLPTNNKEW